MKKFTVEGEVIIRIPVKQIVEAAEEQDRILDEHYSDGAQFHVLAVAKEVKQ